MTSPANPFGKYYAEILRAEGLNAFAVIDIADVSNMLAAYEVVILGQTSLTEEQVTTLSNYVAAGGNLIAMRPDRNLAGLLGLSPTGGILSEAYLLIDNTTSTGAGLVNETVQFHGTADLYTASASSILATLYSDASTPTSNPAVVWRPVGSRGGQAAAFTFDLARSIVYTRQGNPAWQQLRDVNPDCISTGVIPCGPAGPPPIRAYNYYFGAASFDPRPDWIDFSKISIPQADEQQRLLANLVLVMNLRKKPLPRFWYFPQGYKAVVVMTGDDHANGGTAGRFDKQMPKVLLAVRW